jgi:hypothetical protein
MTSDELNHTIDLLESTRGSDLMPGPSLDVLLGFLYAELAKTPQAIKKRNELIKSNMFDIPARSPWARAGIIASQARRLHCGMKSPYTWISRADRIKPLPETQRRVFTILTK